MQILVLNGGTATVKAAVARVDAASCTILRRHTSESRPGAEPPDLFAEAMAAVEAAGARIDAVGHRVVHGGMRFREPVRIDAAVEAEIGALAALAPLHNPVALAGMRAARSALPGLPMFAAFDTAFHAGRSAASLCYALPRDLAEAQGLRRYGFHGIAHASLVEGAAKLAGVAAEAFGGVTLQLGHGCSACAVAQGDSLETSMGFTPLEGLVMGTRSGDVDPALVLHLLRDGRTADEVETLLTRRSGLLGLCGAADMRAVLQAEARGDAAAALALEVFVRRIVTTVGGYFTLLGGAQALVFGGGIGENAPQVRARVAAGLGAWGIALDAQRNARGVGLVSREGSRPVYVVPTDEESWIARAVARKLAA